jgi:acetyl-CoA carboxylase carboxyl transferase subunit alpha
LTGGDLKALGLVDGVVPEPMGGAHQDQSAAVLNLRNAITRNLDELVKLTTEEMLEARYAKFRKVGEFAFV